MNLWECMHPGCKNTAVGVGSGYGLRAIGWYFKRGPTLYCPSHFPQTLPCKERPGNPPCPFCAAESQEEPLQEMIARLDP